MNKPSLALCAVVVLACFISTTPAARAQAVAYQGARQVAVPAEGSDELQDLAKELITYLDQIDTQPWSANAQGGAGEGVRLALADHGGVSDEDREALTKLGLEGYLLRVKPNAITITGNTDLAVQHGMFDLLERLGCRFLTPAQTWTVIPQGTGLKVAQGPEMNEPDFSWRRIWYANGMGVGHSPDGSLKAIKQTYDLFHRATRQGGASRVSVGHSYYATYLRHKDEFDSHPEWARMDETGERPTLNNLPGTGSVRNWCYSNPDLAELVLADRIEMMRKLKEKDPNDRMVSMDPNDGSRPCHCEPCQALGNGSDQVVYLANHVARGLREVYPDALVGYLIYPQHILPPTKVRLEPNSVPSMALAFNQTGLSYAELIDGWIAMGAQTLSIYDYLGVYEWDYGMPKQSQVTYDYVRESIPHFHDKWNAKMFNAQSQASWGRYGPSMYLARKLLWDKDADAQAVYQEYFDVAFGSASQEMRKLFDFWDTPGGGKLSDPNLARWLIMMREALDAGSSETPEVRQRLEDMAAYLHTVVLFQKSMDATNLPKATDEEKTARDDAIKQNVGTMLNFVWRTRERQVLQFWGFMTRMGKFGKPTHTLVWKHWVPGEVRNATAHWMTTHDDFSSKEVMDLFNADLKEYRGHLDGLVQYSADLVPLYPDKKPQPQKWIGTLRGHSVWHVYVEEAGPLTISMHTHKGEDNFFKKLVVTDAKGESVYSQQPTFRGPTPKVLGQVTLQLEPGLYRMEMEPTIASYYPAFDPAVRCVYEQSETNAVFNEYFTAGFFFVPKDVKNLRVQQDILLTLQSPSWEKPQVYKGGTFSIPVGPDGGKLWEIKHVTKTRMTLFNVPPYIANSPENMLVPRELVNR